MAYSQAVVLAGGVAHVPILITALKFLDSKTLKLHNSKAAAKEKAKAAEKAAPAKSESGSNGGLIGGVSAAVAAIIAVAVAVRRRATKDENITE